MNQDQLRSVLRTPATNGFLSVGEALDRREFSSADDLVQDLCKEMGLDFLKDIPVNDIPSDLIRDLPINYAKQFGVLPFKEENDHVVALTSNPLNYRSMDDLRVMFGKRVKP